MEILPYEIAPRREGDIISAYADTEKANKELGWKASRSLDEALKSAWVWQKVVQKKEEEDRPPREKRAREGGGHPPPNLTKRANRDRRLHGPRHCLCEVYRQNSPPPRPNPADTKCHTPTPPPKNSPPAAKSAGHLVSIPQKIIAATTRIAGHT